MADFSPMMQQYFEIKEKHSDQILFFRLGDFYEMFFEDAKTASKELELVLTGRDCGQEERAPMCGIPYHSSEAYIARLIKKGYKVAICEQTGDPKQSKGVVKREVVRVVTPGTLIESNMLDEGSNNYILSIFCEEESFGLAFADISTGRVHLTSVEKMNINSLKNELTKFNPSEVVFSADFLSYTEMGKFIKEQLRCCASMLENEYFDFDIANKSIAEQFGEEARQEIDANKNRAICSSLGGLIKYLRETQKVGVERLVSIEIYGKERYMMLDQTARTNLELVRTMRTGEKKGSLLWVIDKTKTAMGKRLLRRYLEQPLANPIHIEKRLNAVDELFSDSMKRMDLIEILSNVYDLERLLTRIVCGATNPRELCTFCITLSQVSKLANKLAGVNSRLLSETLQQLDPLDDVVELISRVIMPDPPVVTKDGWFIMEGYNEELDKLRTLLTDNKTILAQIETDEREKTGIKNLKIRYNKVFGYYLEVTNSYKDMVPVEYIRKQTLSNCERYITEELKQLEEQILTAREQTVTIELAIYSKLLGDITAHTKRIQTTADAIAKLDVFTSFAQLAKDKDYCRPIITTGGDLFIKDGRHPVVEALTPSGYFVSNDCNLNLNKDKIAIITGPNMAGKSTYIRQVAVITLLAQIGCFVPAKRVSMGVVDGIFTRVGASDDLATGQSTFMVEMNEVAEILKNATSESLIILDEVGRGTSTFDGMSIARAIIEYIADNKKLGAKTLFATHYHELTELSQTLTCVQNYSTAVKKHGDEITFLRRIVPGAVDDSYGIEVSKLAGIPDWIIKRAHEILLELENSVTTQRKQITTKKQSQSLEQVSLNRISQVEEQLKKIDPDTLSPLEALAKLYDLRALL